jgi:hypothetical protein
LVPLLKAKGTTHAQAHASPRLRRDGSIGYTVYPRDRHPQTHATVRAQPFHGGGDRPVFGLWAPYLTPLPILCQNSAWLSAMRLSFPSPLRVSAGVTPASRLTRLKSLAPVHPYSKRKASKEHTKQLHLTRSVPDHTKCRPPGVRAHLAFELLNTDKNDATDWHTPIHASDRFYLFYRCQVVTMKSHTAKWTPRSYLHKANVTMAQYDDATDERR